MELISFMEQTQGELEKVKALVNLIQDYAEEPARIKGTFKNDFEMIVANLAIVYDMVYRLSADLDRAVEGAYRHKKPGD